MRLQRGACKAFLGILLEALLKPPRLLAIPPSPKLRLLAEDPPSGVVLADRPKRLPDPPRLVVSPWAQAPGPLLSAILPRLLHSPVSLPCQAVSEIPAARGLFRPRVVRSEACRLKLPLRLSAMSSLDPCRAIRRNLAAGSKIRIRHRIIPIPLALGARPPCRDRRPSALLKAECLLRVPPSGIPRRIP